MCVGRFGGLVSASSTGTLTVNMLSPCVPASPSECMRTGAPTRVFVCFVKFVCLRGISGSRFVLSELNSLERIRMERIQYTTSSYKISDFVRPKATQTPSESLTGLNGPDGLTKLRHWRHCPCFPMYEQRIVTSLPSSDDALLPF